MSYGWSSSSILYRGRTVMMSLETIVAIWNRNMPPGGFSSLSFFTCVWETSPWTHTALKYVLFRVFSRRSAFILRRSSYICKVSYLFYENCQTELWIFKHWGSNYSGKIWGWAKGGYQHAQINCHLWIHGENCESSYHVARYLKFRPKKCFRSSGYLLMHIFVVIYVNQRAIFLLKSWSKTAYPMLYM